MELINHKELKNLPVVSKSGERIGKISGFELDTDSQNIINFFVDSKSMIPGLFKDNLVISRDQVVSLSKEKMVVETGATQTKSDQTEVVSLAN